MKYTVKRIDEDLDFGCEEHMEGAVMTMVACRYNKAINKYELIKEMTL